MALRSFPNRYLFSLYSKVTSLFSIRYILEIISLGEMTQIVLRFMINHATPKIVSSRNSVRVVFLIARGWRGASLPRVNDRKEIQRRRC